MTVRRFALTLVCALLLASCGLHCVMRGHKHHGDADIRQYTPNHLAAANRDFRYYTRGDGPPVIVLHELPGATLPFVAFTDALAEHGYKVYAPLFFGDRFGRDLTPRQMLHVARSADFKSSAPAPSPELVAWLRAFEHLVAEENPHQRVGVIGMCLTGALPVYLAGEKEVAALVLSQPSVPISPLRRNIGTINVDPTTLAAARGTHVPMLAFRFENDCLSTPARFANLRAAFPPPQLEAIELPSGGSSGIPERAHAVLTEEYRPGSVTAAARDCVMSFLDRALRPDVAPQPVTWPAGVEPHACTPSPRP